MVSCSPDAVDHRDANILDGPEQVLVGDEISPDGAAVGAADVLGQYSTVQYSTIQYNTVQYSTVQYLGQVVQEHSVHPDNRETSMYVQYSV